MLAEIVPSWREIPCNNLLSWNRHAIKIAVSGSKSGAGSYPTTISNSTLPLDSPMSFLAPLDPFFLRLSSNLLYCCFFRSFHISASTSPDTDWSTTSNHNLNSCLRPRNLEQIFVARRRDGETKQIPPCSRLGLYMPQESFPMCDYSLTNVRSRPAKVGDTLITHNFGTGTRGFCASDDADAAVCVLPGTELAFADKVKSDGAGFLPWRTRTIGHKIAIFRQVNRHRSNAHHDALEFPDGRVLLLTLLQEGQQATVLQLPAKPNSSQEAALQRRVAHTG